MVTGKLHKLPGLISERKKFAQPYISKVLITQNKMLCHFIWCAFCAPLDAEMDASKMCTCYQNQLSLLSA